MKKTVKYVILLAAVILCAFSACGAPKLQESEINVLIQKMVIDYGNDPDHSEAQVEEILEKITSSDKETGLKWQKIMDYWRYTRNEMPIYYDELPPGLCDTDQLCIVVLGFQLAADGSIREELAGRLQTALSCAESYPNAYILCTGGGTASQNREVTEAGKMAEWLTEHGVDPSKIIVEDHSMTTSQNAIYSCEMLKADYPSVEQVAIVPSDYHIPWGAVLFEAAFVLDGDGDRALEVVSNAAYRAKEHAEYPFQIQATGLLEIAGLR